MADPRGAPIVERSEADREKMILANVGLIWHTIGKYVHVAHRYGMTAEDIHGYGMLGLIHAVDRFEEGRGLKFSTYAVQCISGYVLSGINRHGHLLSGLKRDYDGAIAKEHGVGFIDADAPVGAEEGSSTWGEIHLSHDPSEEIVDQVLIRSLVSRALAKLTARLRLVIHRRYWFDEQLGEIGFYMRISRERVRQLEAQAIATMARALADDPKDALSLGQRIKLLEVSKEKIEEVERISDEISSAPVITEPEPIPIGSTWRVIQLRDGSYQRIEVNVLPSRRARNATLTAGRL